MKLLPLILGLCLGCLHAQTPSFEEVISLQSVGSPRISPDGSQVVFTQSSTDWENNRFDTEIWLYGEGSAAFPLTRTSDGSSYRPRWSPDGEWIAFLANREDNTQIYLIRAAGGEAVALTSSPEGVSSFEWSPDGTQIAFTQDQKDDEVDEREKSYGQFAVEDAEYRQSEVWLIDVQEDRLLEHPLPAQLEDSIYQKQGQARKLIAGDFHVDAFHWSPDGEYIAYDRQPDPLINSFFHADIYLYSMARDTSVVLVDNPSADYVISWSPDGSELVYGSSLDDSTSNYYKNNRQFIIGRSGVGNREIRANIDEDLGAFEWSEAGLWATAWQKTERVLYEIDPQSGVGQLLPTPTEHFYSYSLSENANRIAFSGRSEDGLTEIYLSDYPFENTRVISQMNAQIKDWEVGTSEVYSWKSKDGEEIEGILHRPADYDPDRSYPLMVVIHGGPTGISTPQPVPAYVYPQIQWMNKGALILRPNYRGSAGYGERFRSLNVRNLGVGDAWDVESGVQSLIEEGLVHADSAAAMGWSQGGYISAFLATNSVMFKAISVGAGISNWMTYYVNTDIHPFTRQYLEATPWSDPDIYAITSPMTNITKAQTPTLIQHGEFDRRVPVPNAYELYQGLQDVGVDTKLIIYKGFGHGISKPKERLAAMQHNWDWFAKYLWGGGE